MATPHLLEALSARDMKQLSSLVAVFNKIDRTENVKLHYFRSRYASGCSTQGVHILVQVRCSAAHHYSQFQAWYRQYFVKVKSWVSCSGAAGLCNRTASASAPASSSGSGLVSGRSQPSTGLVARATE